jgi:Ca2+-binding EF-hand superfamily protein
MGVGSSQPTIFAVEEEDTSSDGFAKAGMSKNISRTAMAGNLFDTIDKSGDGNVSKDELTAILEVLHLLIFAAKLLLIIKLLR